MRAGAGERLLVCYLPGFDLRRITAASCPHVAGLLGTCPWVALRTLPTAEHIPTMLAGARPHQHGLWGPRLIATGGRPSFPQRLIDRLPDVVTSFFSRDPRAAPRRHGAAYATASFHQPREV